MVSYLIGLFIGFGCPSFRRGRMVSSQLARTILSLPSWEELPSLFSTTRLIRLGFNSLTFRVHPPNFSGHFVDGSQVSMEISNVEESYRMRFLKKLTVRQYVPGVWEEITARNCLVVYGESLVQYNATENGESPISSAHNRVLFLTLLCRFEEFSPDLSAYPLVVLILRGQTTQQPTRH